MPRQRKVVLAVILAWFWLVNIAYYHYQIYQKPYASQLRWDYPNLLASLRASLKWR